MLKDLPDTISELFECFKRFLSPRKPDGAAVRPDLRLLEVWQYLLQQCEQARARKRRLLEAKGATEVAVVANKLAEEGSRVERFVSRYFKACAPCRSNPDTGVLHVPVALLRVVGVSRFLMAPLFGEDGASKRPVCPCGDNHQGSEIEHGPKEPIKKKRKSRHLKLTGNVIGTIDGIQDLPQEVLDLICDYVTDPRDSKNLRIVAKCFADRAALNVSCL